MKTKHEIYYDIEKTKPVTDYKVDGDGYAILNTGTFYIFGETKVKSYKQTNVSAYDDSTVVAYDDSTVVANDNSTVRAYADSQVLAYDNSTVWTYVGLGISQIYLHDNSWGQTHENAKIIDRTVKVGEFINEN